MSDTPAKRPATIKNWVHRGHRYPVRIYWAVIDGRYEPVEVTISGGAGRKIDAQLLRRLPFGQIVSTARRNHKDLVADTVRSEANAARRQAALQRRKQWGPQRGVPLSPDDLDAVAAVYLAAYDAGLPVTRAVADEFDISPSTAGKRIWAARQAGLLPKVATTKVRGRS